MSCPTNPSACCLSSPGQHVSFPGTTPTSLPTFFIFCSLILAVFSLCLSTTILRRFHKVDGLLSSSDSHLILCLWSRRALESVSWMNQFLTLPMSLFIITPFITWWKRPFTSWPRLLLPFPTVSLKQMATQFPVHGSDCSFFDLPHSALPFFSLSVSWLNVCFLKRTFQPKRRETCVLHSPVFLRAYPIKAGVIQASFLHMYTNMCTCTRARAHAPTHTSTHAHTQAHMYVHLLFLEYVFTRSNCLKYVLFPSQPQLHFLMYLENMDRT